MTDKAMERPASRREWVLLAFAVVVIGYATYLLLDAINQARLTGLVEIVAGMKGIKAPKVPWPNAWAYLSGLLLFVIAGAMLIAREFWQLRVGFLALLIFVAAVFLFMTSHLLSSMAGATFLVGMFAAILVGGMVDTRFGRTAGLWFMALMVLVGMLQPWSW
ncbi:hypothetical protein [Roseateles asaccharophilus]|uniref:Membrane protein YccC n=1 Tax=Roseateles asaccharophilus TaxID=582607 RepID=A0ABU2ACX7_9BURK|nr:hypothetical protein [Roseateles asaccharophilus]MDR7335040.1 putative membrane protein YccC [Roseateles asaccharophilus]